ncbi:MAG: LppM family (lipo)protein [Actinomyces dentalis]
MRLPSIPRRLVALVPAILMVLAGLGLAPTASAGTSTSDDSFSYEFEIHENKTVDITMTRKGEDAGSKSNCNPDDIEDSFKDDDVKVSVKSGDGGDSCTLQFTGVPIKSNNLGLGLITHEDDSFTFEMPASSLQYYDQVTVKVTFPGSVSKVSGDGKKSGNTATWNNAQDETGTLTAKGADHGSPLFMILIVVVVIAAIGGGVAAFIIIRQKRAKTGIAPGAGMGQLQQPGYPVQPQPGAAPPAQPGYSPQSGQPGHNPQQPYNPDNPTAQ